MAAGGMKRILLALLLLLAAPAFAQTAERAYGADPRQRLDFTPGVRADAPLVLFIHGGAWSFGDKRIAAHMARHFHARGYAFASINYRLVPDVAVEQQADDVAAALASLIGRARLPVVLIGHSAGAHLAALVGTDPRYLSGYRIPLSAIAGVVLLDGAGYDVPGQIGSAGPLLRRMYVRAFGSDGAAQRRLSPIVHAAAPNAGEFLILHVAGRPDSRAQSEALADAFAARILGTGE
jgi:arylformamidase